MAFIEEEVVAAFDKETDPRERLGPARRLLDTCRSRALPPHLVERLMPLASTRSDLAFLINHAPTSALARRVLERAVDPQWVEKLKAVFRSRRIRNGG